MAVLNQREQLRDRLGAAFGKPWLWLLLVLAAPLLAIPACAHLSGPALETPWFPHGPHLGERMLRCEMCHGVQSGEEELTLPTPELCALCHDEIDAAKPAKERIAARFSTSGDLRRTILERLPDEIRFSHREHLTGSGIDCSTCHPDPDAPRPVSEPMLSKRECMSCHAEHDSVSNDCRVCHQSIDQGWVPPTHGEDWKRREHGVVIRDGRGGPWSESSVQRCDLCHDQARSCQACHAVEEPESHDQYFRLRGHGALASMDRSRCDTCHRRDSCQQCHEETRPLNHRGGFGEPLNRHCTGCHFPVQSNACIVCHKGAPSHDLATPLPPDHRPSMNCRGCHGAGQALPHPDGGHRCIECHR